MHFLGCLGFFLFSAFVPILIVLTTDEGWIQGMLIIATWPIAWTFSKTTNDQVWYKIYLFGKETDIYNKGNE